MNEVSTMVALPVSTFHTPGLLFMPHFFQMSFFFFFLNKYYLFGFTELGLGLDRQSLLWHAGSFNCSMWDLFPDQESNLGLCIGSMES